MSSVSAFLSEKVCFRNLSRPAVGKPAGKAHANHKDLHMAHTLYRLKKRIANDPGYLQELIELAQKSCTYTGGLTDQTHLHLPGGRSLSRQQAFGSDPRAKYESPVSQNTATQLSADDIIAVKRARSEGDIMERSDEERKWREIMSIRGVEGRRKRVSFVKTTSKIGAIWIPEDYKKERNSVKYRRDGRYVKLRTDRYPKGHLKGCDLKRFWKESRLSIGVLAKLIDLPKPHVSTYARKRGYYLPLRVSDNLQYLIDNPKRWKSIPKSRGRWGNLRRAELAGIRRAWRESIQ